jgi:hypothetical protein
MKSFSISLWRKNLNSKVKSVHTDVATVELDLISFKLYISFKKLLKFKKDDWAALA